MTGEIGAHQVEGCAVVVDHDDYRIPVVVEAGADRYARALQRDGEAERAADPDLGLKGHRAAHQGDDATAQREAEAGAFLSRWAPLPLLEGLEDPLPVLGAIPIPLSVTVTASR